MIGHLIVWKLLYTWYCRFLIQFPFLQPAFSIFFGQNFIRSKVGVLLQSISSFECLKRATI